MPCSWWNNLDKAYSLTTPVGSNLKTAFVLRLFCNIVFLHFDCRSNWPGVGGLDLGVLTKKMKEERTKIITTRLGLSLLQVNLRFDLVDALDQVAMAKNGLEQRPSGRLSLVAQMMVGVWSMSILLENELRCYPPAFGKRLLDLWKEDPGIPLPCLRC